MDSKGFASTGTTLESEGTHWSHRADGTLVRSWEESGMRRLTSPDKTTVDVYEDGLMYAEKPKSYEGYGTMTPAEMDPANLSNATLAKVMSESLVQVDAPDKVYGFDPRVTTKLADGTVVAKYPKTTYTFKPDGTQIEESTSPGTGRWDIKSMMTEPNGVTTFVHGDGSKMIKRPWTAQGVVEEYDPLGKRIK